MRLVERKIKSTCLYRGRSVSFFKDMVRLPSGRIAARDYMLHPGAVCVVPFVGRNRVLMLKQYRYPVRQTIFEFPAGKRDRGENPLKCARRELLEETGYYAWRIKWIGAFWPTPAFATELMDIYIAWGLELREAHLDPDEALEVLDMDFSSVLDWVRRGLIKDAKSIIAALTIQAFQLFPFR